MTANIHKPKEQAGVTKSLEITKQPFWKNYWLLALAIAVILLVGATVYSFLALGPVDSKDSSSIRFIVTPGETATEIANNLRDQRLIRDPAIFQVYTRLTGTKDKLQAGGYVLKRSYSIHEIIEHISSGKTDEVSVTILPGLMLEELADPDVAGSLAQQGFSKQEITTAYASAYNSALFEGRLVGDSLEGYVYPETYNLLASNSLEKVFQMSFDEFYSKIETNGYKEKLAAQGLSLRQGIILASIVQKEVSSPTEQKQVAQVFLKRYRENIVLGSDVTFMYIAKKEGREPRVDDPSPYNTRRQSGLPPGPISNFSISALEAVANPAPGDFLYFVAGDDGTTYYARTEAEHEQNVAKYCTVLCQ